MTNPDPVAAYHEAGHCIAGLHRGFWIRSLTLSPGDPHKAGCCELPASWEEDYLTADPIGFLVYTFAGGAAEKRLTGQTSARDAQDRETASAIASIIVHDGADAQDPRVQATLRTCAVLADALMLG